MSQQPDENEKDQPGDDQQQRVVVVTQDGMGVAPHNDEEDGPTNPADLVEQPAKVMRIGSMIKQLLEEVRGSSLDEASRDRLREIYDTSVHELAAAVSPDLRDELARLTPPFHEAIPSESELRVAKAQLVGWLEGLFHGIQATLFAQQMAQRQLLEGAARRLPAGEDQDSPGNRPGTYL